MNKKVKDILSIPLDSDLIIKKLIFLKKELLNQKNKKLDLKIAILGGSSTQHIKDLLNIFLLNENIAAKFYEGVFSSFYEEVMYDVNNLSKFQPDIIWIHTTWRNINLFPSVTSSTKEIDNKILKEYKYYQEIWLKAENKFKCTVIQNNFDFPKFRSLSNKDSIDRHGKINFLQNLNLKFADFDRNNSWFHVLDINYLASQEGLNNWQNERDWYMFRYSPSIKSCVNLSYNAAKFILSVLGMSKKCLLIDLDDTLWGGTIGDDGVENINLNKDNPIGEIYLDFQQYILDLKSRGIMLAVLSKNEEKIAKLGFKHPNSILKIKDFSVFICNWKNKFLNLKEALNQLNIKEDSAVFIDNNPVERDEMSKYSNVAVPNIGQDIISFRDIIDKNNYFEFVSLTNEDINRPEATRISIKTNKEVTKFKDYYDYLISLKMRSNVNIVNKSSFNRVVQLVNKTNQFNLTQNNINESQLQEDLKKNKNIILSASLKDKFTDHGLISVLYGIYVKENEVNIYDWVMSCRVFKRSLEYFFFEKFVKECRKKNIQIINGILISNEKNKIVSDLYQNLGFSLISSNKNIKKWRLDLKDKINLPKHAINQ